MQPLREPPDLPGAGLAAVLLTAGCSSGEGEDQSAGTLADSSPTTETLVLEDAILESCAGVADAEDARACYAAALSALVRDVDDPSQALEEIAVAAYSDPRAAPDAAAHRACLLARARDNEPLVTFS